MSIGFTRLYANIPLYGATADRKLPIAKITFQHLGTVCMVVRLFQLQVKV